MYQRCALAEENRERERERETAEGGLANCKGKEDGWGAGGWSWRRKMQFLQICLFSGPDPVATREKEPETRLSRQRYAKHINP